MEKTYPEAVAPRMCSSALHCTWLPQQRQREGCDLEDDAAAGAVCSVSETLSQQPGTRPA